MLFNSFWHKSIASAMETFLWSLLPLNELISLQPDSSPPKCSNIKSGNSAKMRFEIVIIAERFDENISKMPKKPHWAHHFHKSFAPKSQFKKFSWRQGYWLAVQVKKRGVVHTHKPRKGLLIKILKKKKKIGYIYTKSGKKHSIKKITAIWRYGKLDTIHPGKPSKTVI